MALTATQKSYLWLDSFPLERTEKHALLRAAGDVVSLVKRFGEKTLQDFVRLEKWTAWLFELLGSFAFISDDRFSVIIFGELFDFKAVLFIEFNGIFVCFGEYGFYAVIIDQTVYHI